MDVTKLAVAPVWTWRGAGTGVGADIVGGGQVCHDAAVVTLMAVYLPYVICIVKVLPFPGCYTYRVRKLCTGICLFYIILL